MASAALLMAQNSWAHWFGDFVWYDCDQNGRQDFGEPGIPGVLAQVINCADDSVVAFRTTDSQGKYMFYNSSWLGNQDIWGDGIIGPDWIVPLGLNVKVRFVLPAGFAFTTPFQGITPAVVGNPGNVMPAPIFPNEMSDDSKANQVTGETPCFPFNDLFYFDLNVDAGLVPAPRQFLCCVEGNIGGELIVNTLPNGNVRVLFIQTLNDNTYGVNAIGWPGGHKFNDLVGSDNAEFRFKNGAGQVVLDFKLDYITKTTLYPSGYGTLGAMGGDGGMLVGSASSIVFYSTSLTSNLNKAPFIGNLAQYILNSPAPSDPNFPLWETNNIYAVEVSGSVFGPSGFGSVSIPSIHNSPGKAKCSTPVVCVQSNPPPCPPPFNLVKTADKSVAVAGDQVTYTYTVNNNTPNWIINILVTDDNGTPSDPSDDFVVGTIPFLAPGQSASLTYTVTLGDLGLCIVLNHTNFPVGTLDVIMLGNGDLQVTFLQSRNLVDNSYGINAVGWPNGHKFTDLVGSDKAEFRFTDGLGNVVLDFFVDYISQSALYPSGYGTLGVSGGEGKMVVGSSANVYGITTTISQDLNQSPAFYGFKVNSPPDPTPGWNFVDGYMFTVRAAAFGANGFGGVTIPLVHNSPSKIGVNAVTPVPCETCIVNTAVATGTSLTQPVSATATAQVCIQAQ